MLAEARHCSNDLVWQDAVLYNIVGAVKMKNRNRGAALSEFNYVPPQRAGLEDTLGEAVRTGLLGDKMRKMLLDLAEDMVKNDEKEARNSEFTVAVCPHFSSCFEPFNERLFLICRGQASGEGF